MFLPSYSCIPDSHIELGTDDVTYPALLLGRLIAVESQTLASIVEDTRTILVQGYQRAPLLVIALSAMLVLPAIALVSFALHRMARRRAQRAALAAAVRRAASLEEWTRRTPAAEGIPAWPSEAWISVEGDERRTLPIAGQVVRIGRNRDNDIRLPDASVHRYHAVIERTPDEHFIISDLSGKDGNGIRINGERQTKAQLTNGDIIELGRAKLKFESTPI
jgi:hypothetical protein